MFKHILQVLPALESGGVERGTLEIAEYLSQQGIHSSVASSGGGLVQRLSEWGVPHYRLPLATKNPIGIIRNAHALRRVISEHAIDLIHVRSRAPAWSVYLAANMAGIPYISTFHGYYGHGSSLKRWYNSAMLRGAACIAVSSFIEDHIRSAYSQTPKLVRIDRGVDTEFYAPLESDTTASGTSSAIPNERPLHLLMPGRFSDLKGHHLVLDALKQIAPDQITLTMVGSSHNKERYLESLQAKANALPHQIRIISGHQELHQLYNEADVVISASQKPESFGRTLVEAQAMTCLLVAPRQGANNEIIAPELQIGLFEPNNTEALANAIRCLAAMSKGQRARLGRAGRSYVVRHFEKASMTKKTLELYKQLYQDYGIIR